MFNLVDLTWPPEKGAVINATFCPYGVIVLPYGVIVLVLLFKRISHIDFKQVTLLLSIFCVAIFGL